VSPEHLASGAQAVQDVASAMLSAAGKAMTLHGNDPNGQAIVGAAFAMAISKIDEQIDPGFKRHLVELLSRT
jgi:hypothetical protein